MDTWWANGPLGTQNNVLFEFRRAMQILVINYTKYYSVQIKILENTLCSCIKEKWINKKSVRNQASYQQILDMLVYTEPTNEPQISNRGSCLVAPSPLRPLGELNKPDILLQCLRITVSSQLTDIVWTFTTDWDDNRQNLKTLRSLNKKKAWFFTQWMLSSLISSVFTLWVETVQLPSKRFPSYIPHTYIYCRGFNVCNECVLLWNSLYFQALRPLFSAVSQVK